MCTSTVSLHRANEKRATLYNRRGKKGKCLERTQQSLMTFAACVLPNKHETNCNATSLPFDYVVVLLYSITADHHLPSLKERPR